MKSMAEEFTNLGINAEVATKLASLALELAQGEKDKNSLWESVDSLTELMDVDLKDKVEGSIYTLVREGHKERIWEEEYRESLSQLAASLKPCPRCGGQGRVDLRNDDGLCFRCNGPGFFFDNKRLIPDSVFELIGHRSYGKYDWGGPPMELNLAPYRKFLIAEMKRRRGFWSPPWTHIEGECRVRDEILDIQGSSFGRMTEINSPVECLKDKIKESIPAKRNSILDWHDALPLPEPQDELVSLGMTAEQAEKALKLARDSACSSDRIRELREFVNTLTNTLSLEKKDKVEEVIAKEKFLAGLRKKR